MTTAERIEESQAESDVFSLALVPVLQPEHFQHVAQEYRGKVARDMVAHLTAEHRWDYSKFNALNDYQRHLYALFLRLAGIPQKAVWMRLWQISVDVSLPQRALYVEDVLKSGIVGYPALDVRQPMGVMP